MKLKQRVLNTLKDRWYKVLVLFHNHFFRRYKTLKFKNWLQQDTPQSTFETQNTTTKRSVEILAEDNDLDEAIITCYFTKKQDPQSGEVRIKPDIDYIRPWYDSIQKLKVTGIILHDGLDKAFRDRYENEYVRFRQVHYGNYSIFEERWFFYYLFLSRTNISTVFFTDINDVYISKDPFGYVTKDILYVGRDNANKVRHSKWLENEWKAYERDAHYNMPQSFILQKVYNAGVLGGKRKIMLAVMTSILNLILKTQTNSHKDMTLLNLVIYKHFPTKLHYHASEKPLVNPSIEGIDLAEKLVSGFPFTSEFKKNELNSEAFFIHK